MVTLFSSAATAGLGRLRVFFFSARLDRDQVSYSDFDRELLIVVAAIHHFCFILEGRRFVLFNYHKPLKGALSQQSDPGSARQQCHHSFIVVFALTIHHFAGQSNIVDGTLSRSAGDFSSPPAPLKQEDGFVTTCGTIAAFPSPPIDLVIFAEAQASCPDC